MRHAEITVARVLLWCMVMICLMQGRNGAGVSAMEATWTPNEADADDGGPLPLSMNQRQQLLQLEEVIQNSQDPQGTLQKAAEANGMSPDDLVSMLQRNRRDLEQGGGAGGAAAATTNSMIASPLIKLVTTMGVVLSQAARAHPKAIVLIGLSLFCILYWSFMAPRTGLVLSSQPSMLSKGPTTMWNPPNRYVKKLLRSPKQFPTTRSINSLHVFTDQEWRELQETTADSQRKQDKKRTNKAASTVTVTRRNLPRNSPLEQAVSASFQLSMRDLIPEEELDRIVQNADGNQGDDNNDDDDDVDEVTAYINAVLDSCFGHAVDVLSSKQLTEFVSDNKALRLQMGEEKARRMGILVVKKLGDWKRFALVPIKVIHQQESDTEASITLACLKGAHFAGQLHISIVKKPQRGGKSKRGRKTKSSSPPPPPPRDAMLHVSVQLAVPTKRKGKKLALPMAEYIVSNMRESILSSIQTRTRQSLVRMRQSSRYQGKARERAVERRSQRFQHEKELEEMAQDRRRKWQRNNPDAGRYRPSGDRMRSPNNC